MTAAALCLAIVATFADADRSTACRAAEAILLVADHKHPPELLAAIAYGESRFQPWIVNDRGCWGAMQVCGRRPARWTEVDAYRAGLRKLEDARAYCLRRSAGLEARDLLLCTLAGYRSGPAGVRGRWYRGPRLVLGRAAAIRRAMGSAVRRAGA